MADALLGYRFDPGSRWRQYYTSNPRGYFRVVPPNIQDRKRLWELVLAEPKLASLDIPERGAGRQAVDYRVEVKIADPDRPSAVALKQSVQVLEPGLLRFTLRGRADKSTRIEILLADQANNWRPVARPVGIQLGPDWEAATAEFQVTAPVPNALIVLNLGNQVGLIELAELAWRSPLERLKLDPQRRHNPLHSRYFVEYQVNEHGCRDPNRQVTNQAKKTRLVCLGDSCLFGIGVHFEDTVCRVLEDELRQLRGSEELEVLNFGFPAYSTHEMRQVYLQQAAAFEPQLVLVFATPGSNTPIAQTRELTKRLTSGSLWTRLGAEFMIIRTSLRWKTNSLPLKMLAEDLRREGRPLAVVVFRYEDNMQTRALCAGLRDVMGDVAPILDLWPRLTDGLANQALSVHPTDGHPNEQVHRAFGRELARELSATFFAAEGARLRSPGDHIPEAVP